MGRLFIDLIGDTLAPEEHHLIMHPNCAGVVLFSRNFKNSQQLQKLVMQVREKGHDDLLVTVDHEGGEVQRFHTDFTAIPSMHSLGLLYEQDPQLAKQKTYELAKIVAHELLFHGIDFSFGPVLDLHDSKSSIIGQKKRAFHSQPEVIVNLASAWIRGLNEQGMIAIGKHFPGHGLMQLDSHTSMIEDPRSFEELEPEIRPFKRLLLQLGGIMPGHICFPKICSKVVSQSSVWLDKILRQDMGYHGLIVSDCLSMAGSGQTPLLDKLLTTLKHCDVAILSHIEGYQQILMPEKQRVRFFLELLDKIPQITSSSQKSRLLALKGRLIGLFNTEPA